MNANGDIRHLVEHEMPASDEIELTKEAAQKLSELPRALRQAFYEATQENARGNSATKSTLDKDKRKKKNKAAKAARRHNRR